MQTCACGGESPEGALICDHCGKWLDENRIDTRSITLPRRLFGNTTGSLGNKLVFQDGDSLILLIDEQPLQLSTKKPLILGRMSPDNGDPSLVDLSPFGAHQHGVSRQHARITRTPDGRLMVSDLNSANGTFVNGLRLEAGKLHPVDNADRLDLAKLKIKVYYKTAEKAKKQQ